MALGVHAGRNIELTLLNHCPDVIDDGVNTTLAAMVMPQSKNSGRVLADNDTGNASNEAGGCNKAILAIETEGTIREPDVGVGNDEYDEVARTIVAAP